MAAAVLFADFDDLLQEVVELNDVLVRGVVVVHIEGHIKQSMD